MRDRQHGQRGRGRGRGKRHTHRQDAATGRSGRTPDNLVMGRRTLRELLTHAPERIIRVLTAEGRGDAQGERRALVDLVSQLQIDLRVVPREQLDALCGSESHQSFAALVRRPPLVGLKAFLDEVADAPGSLVLMADSVYDPQNLGAMMRAAECFGMDAVVWSRNRGSGLTPTVSKASVGASELLSLIEVSNLVEAIRRFKDAGYWIVAADAVDSAETVDTFDFPAKTAIVMGSEGSGLRDLTRRNVDSIVRIPMAGRIGSLNVSQATAVLLYCVRRHRGGDR